jgi:hypothetical protein
MGKRMTPVEAAKELGIRPQMVYGYIKHNRIGTFNNPEGKTQLVDLDEVKAVTKTVKPHRAKDPTTGKPIKRTAGVQRGSLVTYHAHMKGEQSPRPHRVVVVDQIRLGEDGQPLNIVTVRGDGVEGPWWETEELADMIAKGKCHIESPEKLLGVVMFHYVHTEQPELAASLDLWIQANNLQVPTVQETVEEKKGA